MKIRVVADSSCGISLEEAKQMGLEILPLVIILGKKVFVRDGNEQRTIF